MKYKVILEVELSVEAEDMEVAYKEVEYNKLHLDVCGCCIDYGCYSVVTTGEQRIKSMTEIG